MYEQSLPSFYPAVFYGTKFAITCGAIIAASVAGKSLTNVLVTGSIFAFLRKYTWLPFHCGYCTSFWVAAFLTLLLHSLIYITGDPFIDCVVAWLIIQYYILKV
jgi:hypothetical protein